PSGPEILYLDGDLSGQTSENAPAMGITPQSLAYVVYTSGTTGQPKGVMIEHHSAVNLVQWHLDTFEVSPADRATQIAGPAFDAVVWEIWPVLAGGASLHIPPHDVRGTPRRLQDWLLAEGITISFLPTPLAESMLALPWPATTDLRTLLVGGDVLHAAPQKTLPFRVINNYGPSECTVVATSGAVTTAAVEERPPSIGRPIANMQVHLLDDQLQPVPIGVTGELYIGGAGVARGYLGRLELTEERFLPNPLSLQPGDHLYRTGDLARYRPNGEIEYVGRTDRQVKLRGYRIELGEIESALMRHEAVREAAAVVDEDGPGEKRLMAYIVSQGPPAPAAADLRSFLRRQLPEYMVPAGIVSLQALPITTNGKVNRSALPAHVKEGANREDGSPRTATEALLSSIWAEALGVSSVGIRDNFFDLGGDSLLSIELIERIRLRLRHELAISDLFRAPTVEELARLLEGAPLLQAEPLVPIQPLGALQPFYCVAPVLGTVFPYYKLAQLLGTDRPFYGLQPIGLDAPGTSFTIESLAAHYLAAIRRAQPHGPYSIGGWSFGGIVAFEMARQLHSASEDVSSLVILDTPAPGIHARARLNASVRFLLTMTHGLGGYVKDYEYLAAVTSGRPVVRRLVARLSTTPSAAPPFRPLRSALQRVAIAGVVPPQSRLALYHLPTIREMARSFLMGAAAAVRYRPGVYEGSISLLSAEHGSAGQERGATLGWDELANAKVRVYPVPGNHMTLLREPHIDTVAAALSSALEETLETPQLTAVDVETGVI
ncbi:MAG TPA: amino acid adenylation domain-containing protein, partial [Chloroflexota bacterium]